MALLDFFDHIHLSKVQKHGLKHNEDKKIPFTFELSTLCFIGLSDGFHFRFEELICKNNKTLMFECHLLCHTRACWDRILALENQCHDHTHKSGYNHQ